MDNEQLNKLVRFYQQKHSDAVLEAGQLSVAHAEALIQIESLQAQLRAARTPADDVAPAESEGVPGGASAENAG